MVLMPVSAPIKTRVQTVTMPSLERSGTRMKRRDFIRLFGAAAAIWPLTVRAQQPERMRRIGVLYGGPNDTNFQSKMAAFQQTLQQLGWIEGRNIEFDIRWGSNDAERVLQ